MLNKIFKLVYKIISKILLLIYSIICRTYTWIKLTANGAEFSSLHSNGVPMIDVEEGGKLRFGKNFKMNNGKYYNKIGRQQPSMFVVTKKGYLSFGDGVGISDSTFVCTDRIEIGNNVKIGGNCVFYDTDFHSLNLSDRRDPTLDNRNRKSSPILVGDDVFIGAHTTVLKGVTIGQGSVIGAGSVVSRSIPAQEVWGGNPAAFIKKI